MKQKTKPRMRIVKTIRFFILCIVSAILLQGINSISSGAANGDIEEVAITEVQDELESILSPSILPTYAATAFVRASLNGESIDEVTTEETIIETIIEEPEITEVIEIDPYEDYITSTTELNIRVTPNTDNEVIGILNYGDYAIIKDETDSWYYIESGEILGWVYKEYTIVGEEAYNIIEEYATNTVTAVTDGVRVRTQPSTESEIVTEISMNESLEVIDDLGDWISVSYGGEIRYVNAKYVNLTTTYNTATTIEEIQAESDYEYNLYLLAAIIWCEAGNQSYTGKVAVGAVVLNRVESDSFPDTVYNVIYQSGQFSPVGSGWYQRVYTNAEWTDECVTAAADALNGYDPTDGCLYFSRSGPGSLVIGDHIFSKTWY